MEDQQKTLTYDHKSIEPKWQAKWQQEKVYQPNLDTAKKRFYNLMMFPYPSAEGLHVGNMYAFTGADIYGRFHRMKGKSVFEPIGLDGFGIHSENYALKVGRHPMEQAEVSEQNFYRQLATIGNGFAWDNRLETYDPEYYRWTQWLFTQLFKAGLAYRQKSPVNFCPSCKTVLADEQVEDGKCERCGSVVEKRDLEQWFFRITEYAEELLAGLDKIDWTEKVKIAQRNWIGKSEGARVRFEIAGPASHEYIEVFTTRPDTLYGATFLVVSPEHPFVEALLRSKTPDQRSKVKEYVEQAKRKSETERSEEKEKTGVFSGAYALNPVTNQQIPIWIADYVLMSYGTGAIMAVPAHDERDFEFAKKYDLPIKVVIENREQKTENKELEHAYTGEGVLINSGEWNGLSMPAAKGKVIASLEKQGIGSKHTTYHLRDWLISRQRYWGAPIPMIYCPACAEQGKRWFTSHQRGPVGDLPPASAPSVRAVGSPATSAIPSHRNENFKLKIENSSHEMAGWYPVPDEDLPVLLPKIEDYKPLGTGKAPLASHPEFYETTCPECGGEARRETDVSDTFLDSSWYFLRYLATDLKDIPFPMAEKDKAEDRVSWLPVTMYIGGAEHSVLHLLYTRFAYKVLGDLGFIDPKTEGDEPFPRFYAHGLIIKDGAKMSKSKGNVVVPDEYIRKFGADTLRTYLMFIGPFSGGGDFSDSGIEGIHRFLRRVWTLFTSQTISSTLLHSSAKSMLNQAIKGVTEDLEGLRYNTAIAKIMTYYNHLSKQKTINKEQAEVFLKLLAPFAPHMTEELYQRTMNKKQKTFESIHTSEWPEFDEAAIQTDEVVIAVQVNGKLRDTLKTQSSTLNPQSEIENEARERENVKKYLEGKTVKRVIYVPGKILNFVVAEK